MKLAGSLCFVVAGVRASITATSTMTVDQSHRRLLLAPNVFSASALTEITTRGDRDLRDKLPTDLSICDEYFFGRQTSLPPDKVPFCVNGGL